MILLVKPTNPLATPVPYQKYADDFCYDMYATEVEYDEQQGVLTYKLGVALEIQRNFFEKAIDWLLGRKPCIKAYSRSSIHEKKLILSNSCGIVDLGFRGEVSAKFYTLPGFKPYMVGDRVIQISVEYGYTPKLKIVNRLSKAKRDKNGYGSTGR